MLKDDLCCLFVPDIEVLIFYSSVMNFFLYMVFYDRKYCLIEKITNTTVSVVTNCTAILIRKLATIPA